MKLIRITKDVRVPDTVRMKETQNIRTKAANRPAIVDEVSKIRALPMLQIFSDPKLPWEDTHH